MKRNVYSLLTLLLTVLLFNACKGPAGDPGPAGTQGAKGDTGPKGDQGSVNIISTAWIPVTKQQIIARYDATGLISGSSFTGGGIEKLSQKILDDGIILVYNRETSDKQSVNSVPFTLDLNFMEPGLQLSYYFEAKPKEVGCFIQFSKNPKDINSIFTDEEYRFIFIPGPSGARLKNIDLKDYAAVKKAFNLQD